MDAPKEGPRTDQAQSAILTRCGPENSVACKTYLASIATLLWLGEVLHGHHPRATAQSIASRIPQVTEYLSQWREHAALLPVRRAQDFADRARGLGVEATTRAGEGFLLDGVDDDVVSLRGIADGSGLLHANALNLRHELTLAV